MSETPATDSQRALIHQKRQARKTRIEALEAQKAKYKAALDRYNAVRLDAIEKGRKLQQAIDTADREIETLRQVKDV